MSESRILMGVIGRAHGVSGRVRVTSYTQDPAALAAYGPFTTPDGRSFALSWEGDGIATVSEIVEGVAVPVRDRTAAERLTNVRLYVTRDRLPPPDEEEFYLADLAGLSVVDTSGAQLGRVAGVHDYGGGASLEIEREGAPSLLVPFTKLCVPEVDLAGSRVIVALPEEIEAAHGGRP